ncbi:MAG: hypothetical protein ABJA50_05525 [Chloroflexota bacterium]
MIDEQHHYLSYLLRLWQERATSPAVWRASLENSRTGELVGFADTMQLFAFLQEQVADGTGDGRQMDIVSSRETGTLHDKDRVGAREATEPND